MKKEDVFNLMNAIPPDLIQEADVQAPAKRRLPKLARVGLIAACLCLALIGTAAAVHYSGVSIVDGNDGFTKMQGGIAYHPYDSLSDEVKAIADEHTILPFNSWQKAEDFIGVDLMNNPVLDAYPTFSFPTTEGDKTVKAPCLLFTSPDLYYIRVQGYYRMDEGNIIVESQYYTQNKRWEDREDWDETFFGIRPTEGTELARETYTAPSGLTAQILVKGSNTYLAAFTLNGNPTIIHLSGLDGRATLLQILDGFILSE